MNKDVIYIVFENGPDDASAGLPKFGAFDHEDPAAFVTRVLNRDIRLVAPNSPLWRYGQPNPNYIAINGAVYSGETGGADPNKRVHFTIPDMVPVNEKYRCHPDDDGLQIGVLDWDNPEHWSHTIHIIFKDPNDLKEAREKLQAVGRIDTTL